MESPVSAFAVYNASKNQPKKKKNKKVKNATASKILNKDIGDDLKKEIALKLKRQQNKFKESKNICKKKVHKKKKSKKTTKATIQNGKKKSSDSADEDVPQLLQAPIKKQLEIFNFERSPSQSSTNSFEFTPIETDSVEEGLKVFKWMIAPFSPEDFLNQIWEKKPLHISRQKSRYYNEIISTPIIDSMLRNENIQFTKNIDITSYIDGKRETHNPEGRAHPHLVWDFYLNGCSIRLLNPQTYIAKLHLLNATLQEFFHSFVGANAYLTPPDSQGFAPHYDDIEAFILQTEGKKHWRIYKPRDELETLPRTSSKNFTEHEIGEPILEVTLEAGDMLYFPRGYIHQGVTIDGEHSLHVTVSMYQKHAWADLFEKMIPAALQMTINENIELRRGLPIDIYDNFGLVHSDVKTPRKAEIVQQVKNLFNKIQEYLPIDEAVDQMSKKFQQDVLPPVLTDLEKAVTVYGDTDVMVENGKVTNRVEISLDTRIRLLRKNILRMVSEESIRLYYYAENSLEYHGNELPFLEIEEDLAPGIETLINTYPEYVSVENLDIPNETDKLQLADALWSRGLIMTEYPLENLDDD
ncbi:bifunctional lysine-specific demethylase and histidyl-hydroxylase NO66 [Pararge aegeria]|uniref:Bifunctional lysine-specific demethylase and histidyl-hydroxylase n=2 Tax=Pararge aegeria TaxID=116150 RepID=A0A8S4SPZ3_9NEOP|nr:bifunctional lysine-specific demethylase and histidyl-hydroxylase NO66 [Pararge aegeria]CAH2269036.1 jg16060 [Pararge aegeria aegeria]